MVALVFAGCLVAAALLGKLVIAVICLFGIMLALVLGDE